MATDKNKTGNAGSYGSHARTRSNGLEALESRLLFSAAALVSDVPEPVNDAATAIEASLVPGERVGIPEGGIGWIALPPTSSHATTEHINADDPEGSNPTPHPMPVPELSSNTESDHVLNIFGPHKVKPTPTLPSDDIPHAVAPHTSETLTLDDRRPNTYAFVTDHDTTLRNQLGSGSTGEREHRGQPSLTTEPLLPTGEPAVVASRVRVQGLTTGSTNQFDRTAMVASHESLRARTGMGFRAEYDWMTEPEGDWWHY